jgi:hypothetical protein
MRLDASGNLGIGTSSPTRQLSVVDSSNTTDYQLRLGQAANSGNNSYDIGRNTSSTGYLTFYGNQSGGNGYSFGGVNGTRMVIDTSGNLGVGTTSPTQKLDVNGVLKLRPITTAPTWTTDTFIWMEDSFGTRYDGYQHRWDTGATRNERMRLDLSGNLLVGTTNTNPGGADVNGIALIPGGFSVISALGATPFGINRGTNDGTLINFSQAGTTEGTISVSGTTVSYNGGHLSRYAQTTTAKDNSLVKGTVLSNLDEMNVYTKDGQPVDNEQLNKVKVSDTEGDVNVAGVFVNWSHDEQHNVDEINMAMTGDMIIRIAQGVTVVRGDLLMSAGDGTAKPQDDDIIRSKTVAKVTSNHVTCTYADGSFCVPCVLMAC